MDVKTLCLAVLFQGEATGYEIKKAFEEGPFAHFQRAGFGSIYPALSKLLVEGLAEAEAHEQDGRPDKKVYRLTPSGHAAFRRALAEPPEPDHLRSDLLFLLYFARELPPARVEALIDGYIEAYRSQAERIAGCRAERLASGADIDPGRWLVSGFGVEVYRAAADYLTRNREALLAGLARPMEAAE
ncbi:MAG: PadR family transcriptional regulator [Thalassobaculum sp.]|uniref:PadR family transcriptional regulator n=1 Tax=Thalassobaculum sp. TaxID=2022740 RepID=UPI0032EF363F